MMWDKVHTIWQFNIFQSKAAATDSFFLFFNKCQFSDSIAYTYQKKKSQNSIDLILDKQIRALWKGNKTMLKLLWGPD